MLSHLRWVFVWQRPQHLISRLARGRRTWFVEEPLPVPGLVEPRLRTERHGEVTRVWLEVPGPDRHVCFSDPAADCYEAMLIELLGNHDDRAVWLYTPMAFPVAQALGPKLLIYDVMDDLASFRGAPPELVLRQRQALGVADVVFTGGRSLQRSVVQRRPDAHCFPSGVDAAHYVPAAENRRLGPRQVAGYVGVVDERLDLELIGELAAALPEWEIRVVGPVLKIDAATLPTAPNIVYPGSVAYDELPVVMAGFDVALMPFAINEATRSISPTKTLEYLAAGLPIVSTRIPDVVEAFGELVDIQDNGPDFARACTRVATHSSEPRSEKVRGVLNLHHWDSIADRMATVLAIAGGTEPTRQSAWSKPS